MQQLIKCPKCNDVMLTEMFSAINGKDYTYKICYKQPNHYISIKSFDVDNKIVEICIQLNHDPLTFAIWNFPPKSLIVDKYRVGVVRLPWFEPSLNNYASLLERIRTCLVFS